MRPLRRRMQIIFQDPFGSLNPRMPILDIIGEGLLAQGMTDRKARDKRVEDSLEIVGLRREYTRRYPHEFSGGQRQRIGIARALALGPDFVVCDEPVSALDVSIQSQVLNLLLDLRRDFNLTYLFISHNLSVVQYFSDRVGVMYLGKIVEVGAVEQLYKRSAPPVHGRAPVGDPRPEPAPAQEAPRPEGRRAVAGRTAVRLPVPYPLLAAREARQPRALRDRGAAAPPDRRGPPDRVPLRRGDQRPGTCRRSPPSRSSRPRSPTRHDLSSDDRPRRRPGRPDPRDPGSRAFRSAAPAPRSAARRGRGRLHTACGHCRGLRAQHPTGSPGAPASPGSSPVAGARPTPWPGNAVLGMEALGLADEQIGLAITDLNRGVTDENLSLMREARGRSGRRRRAAAEHGEDPARARHGLVRGPLRARDHEDR